MKKSIVTFALLLGFSALAFASNQPVVNSTQLLDKRPIELNADEQALLERLSKEDIEVSEEELIASLETEGRIEAYFIYDAKGNLVASQEGSVDVDEVPENASLLMTENNVQYYIVF